MSIQFKHQRGQRFTNVNRSNANTKTITNTIKNPLQTDPPRDNTIQTATGRENHKRYENTDTNTISDTICVIQIQVSIQFTIFHGKVMNCALICFEI